MERPAATAAAFVSPGGRATAPLPGHQDFPATVAFPRQREKPAARVFGSNERCDLSPILLVCCYTAQTNCTAYAATSHPTLLGLGLALSRVTDGSLENPPLKIVTQPVKLFWLMTVFALYELPFQI